ncbi:hypothetical protein [Pseudobacteriovorax antillogorgiicola]|nr:hypothetical protein [Pseudobacteriovorax antillogorgiicola]
MIVLILGFLLSQNLFGRIKCSVSINKEFEPQVKVDVPQEKKNSFDIENSNLKCETEKAVGDGVNWTQSLCCQERTSPLVFCTYAIVGESVESQSWDFSRLEVRQKSEKMNLELYCKRS